MEVFENYGNAIIKWFPDRVYFPQTQIWNVFWIPPAYCGLKTFDASWNLRFESLRRSQWTRPLDLAFSVRFLSFYLFLFMATFLALQVSGSQCKITLQWRLKWAITIVARIIYLLTFTMIFNDLFSTFPFLAGSNQRQRGGVCSWIHWKLLWGWYMHGLRDIDNIIIHRIWLV